MRKNIINKLYITIFVMMIAGDLAGETIRTNGETDVSLFIGRLSYSIPIYTIDDPDFSLNISLKYSAEGFKPFEPSGFYGQDWTLVAGGCITRTVQGLADEQKIEYASTPMNPDQNVGMLQAIKDGENPAKDSVFDFSTQLYKAECGIQYYESDYIHQTPQLKSYCEWDRDYMPDIYYFNFCGHKGSFTINNIGEAVIISGDFVRINLLEFGEINNAAPSYNAYYVPSETSRIIIHTIDGYSYEFGGSRNAKKYITSVTINNSNVAQPVPAVTTWYLTKITAPNGRYMTFSYMNLSSYSTILSCGLHSFITDYDWTEEGTEDHIKYFLHKDCLLQSISTSDTLPLNIIFYSSIESSRKYDHEDFTLCYPNLKLDSIDVIYNGTILRKARLNYQYRSENMAHGGTGSQPHYYWRYLNQVNLSGIGRYTMTYDNINPYSGNPWMMQLSDYPALYPKTDSEYKNIVDRYGFWKITSLQGLLREVSLPTGGKIAFTYGEHQYGEEHRFRAVGTQDVELQVQLTSNPTIGGARIEKIETFTDDSTCVETKTFSYLKQGTTYSSGVFYNIYEIFFQNDITQGHPIANPHNYCMIDTHIGYSYVEQTTSTSTQGYKTAYTFDTGNHVYSSQNSNLINWTDSVPNYDSIKEICSGSLTYDGWLRPIGRPLKMEKYKGNAIVKSVQLKYNGFFENTNGQLSFETNSLGCLDTIVCLSKYSAHVARKLMICPDVLEQVITQEYDTAGNIITSQEDYIYDSKLRKKKKILTDSRGIQHFTKYTYPDEISLSYPQPYYLLTIKNRIGRPIETISGYLEDETEYVTGGIIDIYSNHFYMIHGGHHFEPFLFQTLSLVLSEATANYQPIIRDGDSITYDSRYSLMCDYNFDQMNRLISIKPFGGIETTYTWNGIYPATKTIGNQTWAYTYLPHVGVQSVTDPRGITTYYDYDEHGRLIKEYQIVNDKEQILKVYQYHIKTE